MTTKGRHLPASEDTVDVLQPQAGIFDFNIVENFSKNYLATYYCEPPTSDERTVLSFLTRQYSRIQGRPCAIEIGCGPTLHHVLPLAPYVSEIHMADYLPDNLEQVGLWRDGAADAHSWNHYTALCLGLEQQPSDRLAVERREADVRRKITNLMPCDLKSDHPLGVPRQYAAVGCFYVAENIGISKDEWAQVMQRVAALTAPGGMLFMSTLRETNFYVVKGRDGRSLRYPSAFLTERDFERLLPALGFHTDELTIESTPLTGQEEEGVNGVILVAARKS